MTTKYTCVGEVCGPCRIQHKYVTTAVACCAKHQRAVKQGHGGSAYTDRAVVALEAGETRALNEAETAVLERFHDRLQKSAF